jgi:hypothetical protein
MTTRCGRFEAWSHDRPVSAQHVQERKPIGVALQGDSPTAQVVVGGNVLDARIDIAGSLELR